MAMRDLGVIKFVAGEALTLHRLVKLDTTAGQVVYADAGEDAIGTVVEKSVASGDAVAVKLLGQLGTHTCVASAAVAAYAKVVATADGKVDDTGGDPAIGVALEAATADGDQIEVLPLNALSQLRSGTNTETLAATKTLTVADPRIHFLDPGGAGRDVNLPAEASSAGLEFVIVNTADAAEILTIKDDGGTTICTPTQNESATLWCDGTTWAGSVGDNA